MKNLIEQEIIRLFSDYELRRNVENIHQIWELLDFAKEKNIFEQTHYDYYLMKTLALPNSDGLFVLCVDKIINKICALDRLSFGSFIQKRVEFLVSLNNIEKAVLMLTYSLQAGAIFETYWIKNLAEELGLDDLNKYLSINIENEYKNLKEIIK